MFDSRLAFVPKVLQLTQITKEYKNELDFDVLSVSSFMLRKEDRSCDNAIILAVPEGQQSIQVYIIKIVNNNDVILWIRNVQNRRI